MRTIATMHAFDEHHGAVRVEEAYDTDVEDLWNACTDPVRLRRWIADVSGDLRLGGSFYAIFTSSGEGPGRVDACEPPDHLLLTMLPDTDDEQQIEAWLIAEGGKTRLIVENRGLPLAELPFHAAGWQAHLEDLTRSLAGHRPAWNERWTELTPTYQTMPLSEA